MKYANWKLGLLCNAAPYTFAVALIATVPNGVHAQELKVSSNNHTEAEMVGTPTLGTLSEATASLKTSTVSVQSTANLPKTEPVRPRFSTQSDTSFSWTTLETISTQVPVRVSSNALLPATQQPQPLVRNVQIRSNAPGSIQIAQKPAEALEATPPPTTTDPSPTTPPPTTSTDPSPTTSTDPSSTTATEFPHRLYLGPDFFYRDYSEEQITPGFKSNEFGTLFGLQATYDYVKRNSVYFGLGFRYGGGQTTYDGGLQGGGGGTIPYESKTENQFFNIEGRLGYTFAPGRERRFLISPFVALGYHQWNRDISGNGSVPGFGPVPVADTSEIYSWGYLGPGFHLEYKVSRKFTIGLNAKLMVMLGGRIKVEDSFQGVLLDEGRGDLGNTLQYEVELPLTYNLVQNPRSAIDLKFTPYFRSQDISRGKPFALSSGSSVLEPASTTTVFGATLGVQFSF
jgi:Outer membrane protein beta-barrel domain